jgi:hypothetical protein
MEEREGVLDYWRVEEGAGVRDRWSEVEEASVLLCD